MMDGNAHARFEHTAPNSEQLRSDKHPSTLTNPSDLLPKDQAKQRAEQVDGYKKLSEQRAKRKRQQRRDKGRDDKDRGR